MTEPYPATALAKLRHLYENMVKGAVKDGAQARRIAEGLLAPAIQEIEREQARVAVPDTPSSKVIVFMAGAILAQDEGTADNRNPDWPQAVEQAERAYAAMIRAMRQ